MSLCPKRHIINGGKHTDLIGKDSPRWISLSFRVENGVKDPEQSGRLVLAYRIRLAVL